MCPPTTEGTDGWLVIPLETPTTVKGDCTIKTGGGRGWALWLLTYMHMLQLQFGRNRHPVREQPL